MNLIDKNNLFLLEQIVRRNFTSKYKDSILGIFWSVLKPLMIMIIMVIIFSTLFKGRIENYAVYFLAGKCIFDFINTAITTSMYSIKSNKTIILKTSTPKYIFILGAIITEFINFLITLAILLGVMYVTNAPFYFETIPLSIIPIISATMMIIGIGLTLSILCIYFTDIQHLWGVFTLLVMYASAIFYPMDIIPEPYYSYVILNPLFWIINQFRHFFIWGTIPDILNIINSLLISAIFLVLGIIIFKKYEKRVVRKL